MKTKGKKKETDALIANRSESNKRAGKPVEQKKKNGTKRRKKKRTKKQLKRDDKVTETVRLN